MYLFRRPKSAISALNCEGQANLDGVFQRDLTAANARLARACEASAGLFLPFGAINPTSPGWREDLRRCHEVHRMRGIRLHPNYHGYTLRDPVSRNCFEKRLPASSSCSSCLCRLPESPRASLGYAWCC